MAAASVLLVLLATGCSGSSSEGPIPAIQSVQAVRDVSDGAARLTSTVTVTFDRSFTLATTREPLSSFFEIYLAAPGSQAPKRILVDSAKQDPNAPLVITLRVKQLIPDGAELRVARRAFHRNEDGDVRGKVSSELSSILALLAAGPLTVTDAAIVERRSTPEVAPADRDVAAMRTALEAHLATRGATDDVRMRALQRYDAMPATIIPSPKVRAALAALTGTFAEPGIDSILTANNCTLRPAIGVRFQLPPGAPELAASVTYGAGGGRVISLNPFLEGERLDHLMPILAHEAIHCDQTDGRWEEIAATALDTFLYLHLITWDPTLARDGTRTSYEQNTDAMALINSGRRYPELVGVLPSEGVTQVLPGSNSPHSSFASLVAAAYPGIDYNESPDEPLAQQYVAALARDAGAPPGSAFNLAYLDQLLGQALDPEIYLGAISALALAPARS